jgi:FAD/FMN-containing dehydrogenase
MTRPLTTTRWTRGELLTEPDAVADALALNYNQRLQRTPRAIARCVGVTDVCAALAQARDRDLPVTVRAGGHSIGGWSTVEHGLVIDLSPMRWVHVDPEQRYAWVGGGALARDVAVEAAQFGLAAVTGMAGGIGIGGLALSCGEGYLTSLHGFVADNVLAAQLVTLAGDVITVSAEEQTELFWALRGAGANFGVVTAFKLRLHPAPASVSGGELRFDMSDAEALLRHAWDRMINSDPTFWPNLDIAGGPGGELTIRIIPAHVGDEADAQRELDGFRACAGLIEDRTARMSYLQLLTHYLGEQGVGMADEERPCRTSWDLRCFPADGDDGRQIAAFLGSVRAGGDPSPGAYVSVWRTFPPGPVNAPSAVPRLPGVSVMPASHWQEPSVDDAEIRWVRAATDHLVQSGVTTEASSLANHVDHVDAGRVRAFFGDDCYDRLAKLKSEYDPDNVFRSNFNIEPASATTQ